MTVISFLHIDRYKRHWMAQTNSQASWLQACAEPTLRSSNPLPDWRAALGAADFHWKCGLCFWTGMEKLSGKIGKWRNSMASTEKGNKSSCRFCRIFFCTWIWVWSGTGIGHVKNRRSHSYKSLPQYPTIQHVPAASRSDLRNRICLTYAEQFAWVFSERACNAAQDHPNMVI